MPHPANIYVLTDYEESVWVTHERKMDQNELRALLIEHLRPIAEEQEALEQEGVERFGKGAKYAYVERGKVYRWTADGSKEPTDNDPVAFEEWSDRLGTSRHGGFERMLASAGFTKLEATAGVWCPDRSPLEMMEKLEGRS